MDEGTFLLLINLIWGIPLLIAGVLFAFCMLDHNKYLNEKLKEMDDNENRKNW